MYQLGFMVLSQFPILSHPVVIVTYKTIQNASLRFLSELLHAKGLGRILSYLDMT